MNKQCRYCNKEVPNELHGLAQYCSKECMYLAKLERSLERYHMLKERFQRVKLNEGILEHLYKTISWGIIISLDNLEKSGLDLGFTTGEVQDEKSKRILKCVGKFMYYINPNSQIVSIWSSE